MTRSFTDPNEFKKLRVGTFSEKVFSLIDMELIKRDSFFFEIAQKFGDLFYNKYGNQANEHEKVMKSANSFAEIVLEKSASMVNMNNTYKKVLKDVKDFLSFLKDCLIEFIKLVSISATGDSSLVPKERTVKRLAAKLVFGRNSCYDTLWMLIRLQHKEDEKRLKSCLTKLKHYTPKQFHVDDDFCLKKEEEPYQQVIDSINYLETFTNPYDKFDLIVRIRKEIVRCIDEYYLFKEPTKNSDKLQLTADTLMAVYCYCLANCCNEKMRIHQVLIEEFVDDHYLKFGEEGYYYSTFMGAIDFLESISDNPEAGLNQIGGRKA
jgi:Vacuolar sorting protein 9 (VPS9) domain.